MRINSLTVSLLSSFVAVAVAFAPIRGAVAAPAPAPSQPVNDPGGPEGTPAPTNPNGPEGTPAPTNPNGPEGTPAPTNPNGPEGTPAPTNPNGPEGTPVTGDPALPDDSATPESDATAGQTPVDLPTPPPATEAIAPTSYIPEDDGRPPEPQISGRPATGMGLIIAGAVTTGVGLGLTLAFGLITRRCSFDGPLQCRLQNQDTILIPLGAVVTVGGAMVLGVGLGYRHRYRRWQNWSGNETPSTIVPTASRHGGGLAWVGRF